MTPAPGMSPEDRAIFDQLSRAIGAEGQAASAGPPPAAQLAAMREAVSQQSWFWVRLRARFGGIPSIIGMAALVAAVTAGIFLANAAGQHGPSASTSGPRPPGPGPTTSSTIKGTPGPPPGAGGTPLSPPNSSVNPSATASAGATGQAPAAGGPSGPALAASTQSPPAGTSVPPSPLSPPAPPTPPPTPPPPPPPPPPPSPPPPPPAVTTTTLVSSANPSMFGQLVTFTATVSPVAPGAGVPSGSVRFAEGSATLCSAAVLSGGHASCGVSSLAAGSHAITASYSGDTDFAASTSAPLAQTVTKAATATSTVLRNAAPPNSVIAEGGSVPLATSVFDTASLSGQVDGRAITGTVTYHFFTTFDCRGTSTNEPVTLGAPSSATGPLSAGSYSFEAVYSGDVNYTGSTSACEHFTVSQAATNIATTIHNAADGSIIPAGSSVPAGTTVFDAATVTGVPGIVPTGTVTYTFFNHGQCTGRGNPAGGGVLVGGVPPNSSPVGPLAAGTYAFRAVYSGDVNYTGSTTSCESERFAVVGPTSLVTHGDVTCQEFTSGTAASLAAGRYSVMGTTINGVNPGVFLYYSKVIAPAANFVTSIHQSNDSTSSPPYPNIPIDRSQIVVYDSSCQAVTGVRPTFPSIGNANLAFSGATPGATYIVSVKYFLTSLKGEAVPPKDPLTYTFSADVNGTLVGGSRQTLLFERRATRGRRWPHAPAV